MFTIYVVSILSVNFDKLSVELHIVYEQIDQYNIPSSITALLLFSVLPISFFLSHAKTYFLYSKIFDNILKI